MHWMNGSVKEHRIFRLMALKFTIRFGAAVLALLGTASAAVPLLKLQKGDHIAIVGSGLADRQQHQAWFESLIHKTFADQELTFRNLGFAADEINIHPRSKDVPPTEWFLAMKKGDSSPKGNPSIIYKSGTDFGADVILAYWGFNESFRGPQGLADFKKNLGDYLDNLQSSKFNGLTVPRIVLFSPIAQEDMRDPNFSTGAENNRNIALYTQAMAEVAKSKTIPFVDLFTPSKVLYQKASHPLTINGIHLTDEGDKLLAPIQFEAVFGNPAVSTDDPTVTQIRAATLVKNYEWSHRYRTVDQFNIYGDRSRIDYKGVNNAKILGQEMAQRDVKTANRDKHIWSVAKGEASEVVDDNLPPVDLTPPNIEEEVPYSDPEEVIKNLAVAPGCKIELVASEKLFPELINPVQMNFDTKGRLWIAAWPSYPETTPTTQIYDKILIVDLDPKTGKAAKITTFMDGLNCPTGFQFYKDGILLMQSPDLLWVRDTNDDGKADKIERVLHGLDAADSHHETNSICLEPGGAVYLSDGVFHRSNVETFNGPIRNIDGGIYRYEPLAGKFMRHAPYGFANPHGRVFDYWGNDLITDATGNENYFGPAFTGHLDSGAHPQMKQFWNRPSRPCAGTAILTSRHFPDDWQGLFLNTNVISIQGIFRAKLAEDGSGISGETLPNLVQADLAKAPNFRPSGITVAPDGSLYFMDWSQMLIGHLQHHLRDPNRDHQHGRLYRITYEGRKLMEPKKIDGQTIPALLDLLKEPENDVRLRAKIELGKHDAKEVTDAVMAWVNALDPKESTHEHNLLEALWVHQWHNVINLTLLERVLKSPEPRARAQGVRVLGYWRERVPNALAFVKAAADDEAPRVRLEAVRVASFFRETAAADAALTILKHPTDYYLEYCFKETMRQLQPWWKSAVSEGKEIAKDNPVGIEFLLETVASSDLAKMPKSPVVYMAMLTRPDMKLEQRMEGLTELIRSNNASQTEILSQALSSIAARDDRGTRDLCSMLLKRTPEELNTARASIQKLITADSVEIVRESATAALLIADGQMDAAWANARKSQRALIAFLNALPLIPDEKLKGSAYPVVSDLLGTLPKEITTALNEGTGKLGRFIRIELPLNGTLSLAEVQVFSRGINCAVTGKASQKSTSYEGMARRAIDGNTDGIFNNNSVTHSEENEKSPWWELDLGSEQPIESVTIWNRTDDILGERLAGFDLRILDSNRNEVFKKSKNPAPEKSAQITLHEDLTDQIKRSTILALVALNREPQAVFGALSNMIRKNDQTPTAAHAMNLLPANTWSADNAAIAAKGIVDWARTIPANNRTSKEYLETISVANKLIALLPTADAETAANALKNLDVKTFTIKSVREKLSYDTTRIVVQAGKPFQVIFENPDAMPHNLVFVKPGTLEDIATAVQTQAPDKLDSKGRAYVPENDPRVIDATRLVEAGKSETLNLTAPTEEGIYQYVCTFPGHWAIMKGELVITNDVNAWLSSHPGN